MVIQIMFLEVQNIFSTPCERELAEKVEVLLIYRPCIVLRSGLENIFVCGCARDNSGYECQLKQLL